MLEAAALAYASRGWYVAPAFSVVAGRCTCGHMLCSRPGEHLRVGLSSATTSPTKIRGWWARWPNSGVAIATGSRSSLLVIAADDPTDLSQLGPIPPTMTVRTPTGGRHLYFHLSPAQRRDMRRRSQPLNNLAPGVSTFGEGGFVLAPPSRGLVSSE